MVNKFHCNNNFI